MIRLAVVLATVAHFGVTFAANVSPDDASARLKMAMQIARERNDKALVALVEKSSKSRVTDDAELRKVESAVGIDPGGWSMAGQPLAHPTLAMTERLKPLRDKLNAAMKADDPSQVRAVTTEMAAALGDQAGVPDGRRQGVRPTAQAMSEAEAAQLFVAALKTEKKRVEALSKGHPLPDQMARVYVAILQGVCEARGAVEKHTPDHLEPLDRLAVGCAKILMDLQQPSGLFPFPDLRGKNIRFGDMLTKAANTTGLEVKDGWVLSADADGGSQFDTGVCGSALLKAGEVYQRAEWKSAGLRAADWALAQRCVPNFNYNSFSVSLLARAFKASGESKYLDGALNKLRVGVAPGQAANGRWIDSHNARTVYHVIIIRALGDLASALDAERRAEVDALAKPALAALLSEFDAMGITVEALPELLTFRSLYPEDAKLKAATSAMAASIILKCTDGKRVKMGTTPLQLAAVISAAN